jgi:hypothetical protein
MDIAPGTITMGITRGTVTIMGIAGTVTIAVGSNDDCCASHCSDTDLGGSERNVWYAWLALAAPR